MNLMTCKQTKITGEKKERRKKKKKKSNQEEIEVRAFQAATIQSGLFDVMRSSEIKYVLIYIYFNKCFRWEKIIQEGTRRRAEKFN